MSTVEPVVTDAPMWLADIQVCHICMDDEGRWTYCGGSGHEGEPPRCSGFYDGEAVCPSCGNPTCPRCAQLEALDDALEDA